jgi:hypothetical protein
MYASKRTHLLSRIGNQHGTGVAPTLASILTIRQAAPAELLSQNTIFFAKIGDDPQLTLIHPAGNSDQHEPEWIQHF